MITQIQLGNVFSSGDQTVFGGSASGLDTESLVEGLVEAKRLPAVQLETRLEENAAQQSAIAELKDIMNRFKETSDLLRNPPGVNNEIDDIFEYRTAVLTSNSATGADNYATATVEPGVDVSSFDLTVDQLATYNTKITETFALADADTDAVGAGLPFNAGSYSIGPNAINVTIDADDTLNEVVSKINAVSEQSNVRANIIQVSPGQYRVSLKTTETGTANNYEYASVTPPYLATDAVFRIDAQDVDGDGDTSDESGVDVTPVIPTDSAGTATLYVSGASPTLDVDGAENGAATLDFTAGNQAYRVSDQNAINSAGPYQEKALAFSFQTGADISGTQTIYEQGASSRSIGLYIQEDAGNGNAPTLYGVVHNGAWAGNEWKVINLGTVSANTTYDVVLNYDASANPTVNDPANTFTGYVNGAQVAQETAIQEMSTHGGTTGIGATLGSGGYPDQSVTLTDAAYFKGTVNEISMFNRTLSNTEVSQMSNYLDDKFTAVGLTDNPFNIAFAVEESAQDAIFTIDSTTVTRSDNSFNDVVDGITFNLKQVTPPGTELTLEIEPDSEVARDAILNFVDTYNELRVFFSQQTLRNEDGSPTEDSALLGNTTLNTTMNRILNETARVVDGLTNGDPTQLSEIGIEFTNFPGNDETPFTRNIMIVDEATLMSALEADFDAVKRVFAFDFSSDEPNLEVFQRTNDLDVSSFTLDIDVTNGTYQATYDPGTGPVVVNLDASALSGNGFLLKGQEGTVLEGLELIYASTDDSFGISVNATQGIGDSVYNALDALLDSEGGLIPNEEQNLLEFEERIEEEIVRIDESVERYRRRLLEKFAGLEAVISQAETILQSLEAQANAAANR